VGGLYDRIGRLVMNDNGVVMMMPMMVMMTDDDHRRVRGRSIRHCQSDTGQSSKSKNELSHLDFS
jgi:hypothetical protein